MRLHINTLERKLFKCEYFTNKRSSGKQTKIKTKLDSHMRMISPPTQNLTLGL